MTYSRLSSDGYVAQPKTRQVPSDRNIIITETSHHRFVRIAPFFHSVEPYKSSLASISAPLSRRTCADGHSSRDSEDSSTDLYDVNISNQCRLMKLSPSAIVLNLDVGAWVKVKLCPQLSSRESELTCARFHEFFTPIRSCLMKPSLPLDCDSLIACSLVERTL